MRRIRRVHVIRKRHYPWGTVIVDYIKLSRAGHKRHRSKKGKKVEVVV